MAADPMFERGALLLLDKPAGITSHDAVERVRRATGVKKVGHTGTLDPMATGLLLLCCGRAARLQGFFTGLPKTYEGVIALGRATDTYDREGETTSEFAGSLDFPAEELERAASAFRGRFEQVPPPYSAKKVGGQKLYELARKGQAVEAAAKTVEVREFVIAPLPEGRLSFRLACTSGTYVRSIAHELGKSLGCGAHLAELRRTSIGDFSVADSVPLAGFEAMDAASRAEPPHALPLALIPFPFPRMAVASLEASKIARGQAVPARLSGREGDWICMTDARGEVLALGQITPAGTGKISMVRPRIVLAREGAF